MLRFLRSFALFFVLVLGLAPAASAQGGGWDISLYPIFVWVPTTIDIDVNLPPINGGGGGDATGGGSIVDPRFDGAYLGGISATNGTWRVDGDVVYAAVGGDRPERPKLTVDLDLIYFHAVAGPKLFGDLFLTGGIRRMALDYDIKLLDFNNFNRKPGVWDPVVGLGYHKVGNRFELHGIVEGGGFGVGTDWEYAATVRADWKPIPHFGFTGGYSFLAFKIEDEVGGKTLIAEQTLHGPIVGIGLYF